MAFTTSSLFIAACFVGAANAVLLIQQKADVVIVHVGGPPSPSGVEDQLGSVNDTLDQVRDTLDTINSTAYGLMATFFRSTAEFGEILSLLQNTAEVATMFGGGGDIIAETTKLIELANSSIAKAQVQLLTIVAKVDRNSRPILPAIQKIANLVVREFKKANEKVLEVYNITDSPLHTHARKSNRHLTNATEQYHIRKGKHKMHDKALLQERAFQSDGAANSLLSLDKSISQKGSSNLCSKALASISTANTTIGTLTTHVGDVNTTGFAALGRVMDVATGALDMLNSTITSAVDDTSAIPSSVLSLVTKALDKVLSISDTLSSISSKQLSNIQDMVEDAQSTLSTLYSLSGTLIDAVGEVQCEGACGAKMKSACES